MQGGTREEREAGEMNEQRRKPEKSFRRCKGYVFFRTSGFVAYGVGQLLGEDDGGVMVQLHEGGGAGNRAF